MTEFAPPAHSDFALDAELLERIRLRAAGYDQANAFFTDDLTELVAAGYLRALVPAEFGGLGLTLAQTARLQTRLAAHAPATALAINMHLVWTGVAKVLHDRGDDSLDFVLREAGQGEIFAFGVSEPGNDLVLFDSTTDARPESTGGYRFTGTKVFTSLSPAWTRLGTFGRDNTAPDDPRLIWAFLDRTAPGIRQKDDWDTLGMRASQSQSTVLEGAHAAADRVVRRFAVGPQNDPLIFAIFANFEILLASVYAGIGQRAVELAVDAATRRTSRKNDARSHAQDPIVRWRVADAAIAMDGLYPQIDALANDIDERVDVRSDRDIQWYALLSGLKFRATETAKTVVDQAVRVTGGSAYAAGSEIGRLYRDVLAGLFHPSDADSAHSTVATAWLGPSTTPPAPPAIPPTT
ncbi:acyl-CoA dehydrogenase [Cryobacterium frigoriphilum]|uniref:Acyl-CoA dehydrogenase n=1 Tax=Cryobacterium frigoriphilum TaxID=1259150 RepID=A0A4R8ZT52_9MICO|nr:acyl-CoA dehydrogenase family protein [Cryobacterium frigoriphilum]TFD44753.1 acyl-CoA dehydrogenase [Cryobacterium frigoriphilum]